MKKRCLRLAMALMLMVSNVVFAAVDVSGRETEISEANRVVSLTPSGTEIIFALGASEKLVGISNYCDYPEGELDALARCGDYMTPDLETIISLEPDLVVAGNYLQNDVIEKLKALGIAVVAAEATSYASIADSIRLIAECLGVSADSFILEMEQKEARILEAVAGQPPKTCYFAVSFYDWGDYSAGPGSFPYDIMTLIGLAPITEGMEYAWPMYSLEALVESDPEIIFLSCDEARAEAFFTTAGYGDLTATKEGRVYLCDPNASARPSPRILDVMAQMAQDAYGIEIE